MAPQYLYRLWDDTGALLYVGISKTAVTRLTQHHDKPWADQIATMTAERFPDRDSVRAAEIEAIGAENPRYNVADRDRSADRRTSLQQDWDALSDEERDKVIAGMEGLADNWPEGWSSPSDRAVRGSCALAAGLMRRGMTPTQALAHIYGPKRKAS